MRVRARLERWIRALIATLDHLGARPTRLGLGLAAGLFLIQNANVFYYAAANADARAIVRAFDDDAGNAIDVVGRSRWVTDNGFASYGPTYFRVASTLAAWLRPIDAPDGLPADEARTKADHLALMLTSLVAVAALSLLCAGLVTREPWLLLVLATTFEWAFLRSGVWQYLILKAHPDHLLGLIVALACVIGLRGWSNPADHRRTRAAAWAWGVALATKASVILFTPAVGLAFVAAQTKDRVRRAVAYVSHVALAYFVIGFPQNFNLPRLLRFLKYQSGYSKPATPESVREWFGLWGDQLVAPLAVAVIVIALAPRRKPAPFELAFAALVALAPFVALLPQRVLAPHEHYPIPIVAAQIALLLALFVDARRTFAPRARVALTLAALTTFWAGGIIPRGFDALLTKELAGRAEARAVFADVTARVARGERIYADPYVPTPAKSPLVKVDWRTTRDVITGQDFDAMVLNRTYFARYFDAERRDYVAVYNAVGSDSAAFYALFRDAPTEIRDAGLGHWRRDAVRGPWEIWSRVRDASP